MDQCGHWLKAAASRAKNVADDHGVGDDARVVLLLLEVLIRCSCISSRRQYVDYYGLGFDLD